MNLPANYHKHKCAFCAFVWQHHDVNDLRHGNSGAHECPSCHRCNWSLGVYIGPEEAKVENGANPGPSSMAGPIHPDQLHGRS